MPKIVATKEDWIKLGYVFFSDSGITGLNVDKMSRELSCNKSSFYWHFKTKKDFIKSLIEYWISVDTYKIIEEVNKTSAPIDKLRKLIQIAFKKDSNLDFIFYLKRYAQSDIKIKKQVEVIDRERIEFVTELIMRIGYSKTDAALKAGIFYNYLIGYHETIRYKAQEKNYLSKVLLEINQFIHLDGIIKK